MARKAGTRRWRARASRHGFRGVYINLDRAGDRRAWMEEQLRALDLEDAFVRLPAVDGKRTAAPARRGISAAEVACFMSHAEAIGMAAASDVPVCVLEDDVRLTPHLAPFVAYARDAGLLDTYDLVMTDVWVDLGQAAIEAFEPGTGHGCAPSGAARKTT